MSDCIFCRIVSGEIPTKFAHQDEEVVAFHDVAPKAPVHLLIIPRRHLASLSEARAQDGALLGRILLTARELAAQEGLDEGGYRLLTNVGMDGGQSVAHLHFHLLGGRRMGWPPG